jgi:hypothetical protein
VTDSTARRHAPATLRNRDSILSVLEDVLPATGTVLEVASGSGEHTAYFAPHFPALTWQPSDGDAENFDSIRSWASESPGNILEPINLDTREHPWPLESVSAIICMNMIHISPWTSAEGLMRGASSVLETDGVFYLYGPFRQAGVPFAPSNAAFDESLKQRNPAWGIRDLSEVEDLAGRNGLTLERTQEMPANNLSVIFHKSVRPS